MQGAVHILSTRCSRGTQWISSTPCRDLCLSVEGFAFSLSVRNPFSPSTHGLFVLFSGIQPHCTMKCQNYSLRNTICTWTAFYRWLLFCVPYGDPYARRKDKYQIKQENIQFDISDLTVLSGINFREWRHCRLKQGNTNTCSPPHVGCIIWWGICWSAGWINSVWLKSLKK